MENNNKNQEQELLDAFNNFVLNYSKKLSFKTENFGEDIKQYDIEILYAGKKLTNFVQQFPHFCFIENKVYIPCDLIITHNGKSQYVTSNLLNHITNEIDMFSINNNEYVRKELFQYLGEGLYYTWINRTNESSEFNSDYVINLFLNKLIYSNNIEYIYDNNLLGRDTRNHLVFVNIIDDLDDRFKNLLNINDKPKSPLSNLISPKKNKNKSISFDYDNADSAKYHEKFNELLTKFNKLSKLYDSLMMDCFNLSNENSKNKSFSKNVDIIKNNIYALFKSKQNNKSPEITNSIKDLLKNIDINNTVSNTEGAIIQKIIQDIDSELFGHFRYNSSESFIDNINDFFINFFDGLIISMYNARIPANVYAYIRLFKDSTFINQLYDLQQTIRESRLSTRDLQAQINHCINNHYANEYLISRFFTNEEIAESQTTRRSVEEIPEFNMQYITSSTTTGNITLNNNGFNSTSSQ